MYKNIFYTDCHIVGTQKMVDNYNLVYSHNRPIFICEIN